MHYEDHAEEEGHAMTDSASAKVTRFEVQCRAVADRYAEAWPEQSNSVEALWHKQQRAVFSRFQFANEAEAEAWLCEHSEQTIGEIGDLLREREAPEAEDDVETPWLMLSSSLRSYTDRQGGVLGIYLTAPGFMPIIAPREVPQLHRSPAAKFSDMPPVYVRPRRDIEERDEAWRAEYFCAIVIGEDHVYLRTDMPSAVCDLFDRAIELCDTEKIRSLPVREGLYSAPIRKAYREFAKALWAWHIDPSRETKNESDPSILDAALPKQTSQMFREVESAYSKPDLFAMNESGSMLYQNRWNPKARKNSALSVVIAPHTSYGQFLPLETLADLKSKVDSLTPNGPFMVAITMALAIQNTEVSIALDDFIKLLGLDPRSSNERRELRQKVWECIRLLAHTSTPGKLNGRYFDHNRKPIETIDMSPIIAITGVSYPREMGLGLNGSDVPVGVSYVAGAFYSQHRANRQILPYAGNIKGLADIPPGQPGGKWARSIGLALFQYWRENTSDCSAKRVGEDSHLSVSFAKKATRRELFAHIRPDPNPFEILESANPKRARDYWDQAEQLLKSQKIAIVIHEETTKRPRQGWQNAWLDEELDIRPHPGNAEVIGSILEVFQGAKAFKKRASKRKQRPLKGSS